MMEDKISIENNTFVIVGNGRLGIQKFFTAYRRPNFPRPKTVFTVDTARLLNHSNVGVVVFHSQDSHWKETVEFCEDCRLPLISISKDLSERATKFPFFKVSMAELTVAAWARRTVLWGKEHGLTVSISMKQVGVGSQAPHLYNCAEGLDAIRIAIRLARAQGHFKYGTYGLRDLLPFILQGE